MPSSADDNLIQNFQRSALTERSVGNTSRKFADGVFCLNLAGKVGADEKISLLSVRDALAPQHFDHLHILINTTGGVADEAFRIYEYLRSIPVPISIEVQVQCLSAGMIILMAGDLRFSLNEVELLSHPASSDRMQLPEMVTASILFKQASHLKQTDDRIAELFSTRTSFDAEWFRSEAQTEDSLPLSDAIISGLLHESAGLPMRIDPSWPNAIKATQPGVYLPEYLRSRNYFNACKCAASLYGEVSP